MAPARGTHRQSHFEAGSAPGRVPDRDLAAVGVDYQDAVQTLEDQAVTAFRASWDRLSQQVSAALHEAAHAAGRAAE